jgi:hypothetical protein
MAMKTIFKPLGFLLFATAIISCSKDEEVIQNDPAIINAAAKFEYSKGDDPFTYEFKNLSTNYKRLEWRFGDDTLSTSETPSHVFLSTGIFTVDLRAISETGAVSRTVKDIKIVPDDILKINGVPGSGANKVKYSVTSQAKFVSLDWKLVDNFTPKTVTTTSKDVSPEFALTPGTLTDLTLTGVTSKGSKVVISKSASPAGIVTNINSTIVKGTPSRESTNSNETSAQLIANKVDGKIYLGWSQTDTWQYVMELSTPAAVTYYGLANGNDSPDRDPKSWKMEGSNDGISWTVLDERTMTKDFTAQLRDRGFSSSDADTDWKRFYFQIANPRSFQFYRFNLTANWGSGGMQFGKIILFK